MIPARYSDGTDMVPFRHWLDTQALLRTPVPSLQAHTWPFHAVTTEGVGNIVGNSTHSARTLRGTLREQGTSSLPDREPQNAESVRRCCSFHSTMASPLVYYCDLRLVRCDMGVVGAANGRRVCGPLERLNLERCLVERRRCSCVAGVVARIGKQLEFENYGVESAKRHGEVSGAGLAVSLLAVVLTSCPPALSADLPANAAMCSLRGMQANGYEYAYPESWVRDRIRGIEVLAHDPEVTDLNMSIVTGPAQSGTLSGSATEVGDVIIAQYKKSPTIDKVELLGVDLKQDEGNNRSYSVELSIEAGGKQRHLLTKLIRTDRKVLSLTLQVPEELWISNESCMKFISEKFKQAFNM